MRKINFNGNGSFDNNVIVNFNRTKKNQPQIPQISTDYFLKFGKNFFIA